MYKNICLIVILIANLCGCAHQSRESNIDYLKSDPLSKDVSAQQIEKELTRTCDIAGVRVSMYPVTGALKHAQNQEEFYKSGFDIHDDKNKEDYGLLIDSFNKNITKEHENNSVFYVTLTNEFLSSDVNLNHWGFSLVYDDVEYNLETGHIYDVTSKSILYSEPVYNPVTYDHRGRFIPGLITYRTVNKNINIGIGSFILKDTDKKSITLSKGFKIIVKPRFRRDIKPQELEWLLPKENRESKLDR